MANKLFFCTFVFLGASAVYGQITTSTIENITGQTATLRPLVVGTNATFGTLLSMIDATVGRINTATSTM